MRTLTFVFCDWPDTGGVPAGGNVVGNVELVNEFDTRKLTVVSAFGARLLYGLESASAVKPLGSVRLTVPFCAVSLQLWTTTGSVSVSPAATVCTAAERPSRRAAGAVVSSQLSNSAQLPQRWKRPSTGETTRTTWSV